MSFSSIIEQYRTFDIESYCNSVSHQHIAAILNQPTCSPRDFSALLSASASEQLESMAQKAASITRRQFGNAIVLFTPMYISNYCTNVCPYCSFSSLHTITRNHLSSDEITCEARQIANEGIRHILLLTGEAPSKVTIAYLEEAIHIAKRFFSSVAIEVYPLSENDYRRVISAGTDMLTLYQETYNSSRYHLLHTEGPKSDFQFRLDAPERACKAGIRSVTVGALYGLSDWRHDALFTALHAAYLQKKYPGVEIGISFPRLRPQAGSFNPPYSITDRQFVQMLTAMRIFLPSAGITMSTRESSSFRMSLLPLGITRMSAGVSTSVGGHSGSDSTPQFEIADSRNVQRLYDDLLDAGYQPVLHDWNTSLVS